MLDKWTIQWLKPVLTVAAKQLHSRKVMPDQVTLTGFAIGMTAVPLLAWEQYTLALFAIIANRTLDGLDGALARLSEPSDAGAFLDITLDFIFYAGVVFGFAWANPEQNALMASLLIFSFMGTGASFLAYAIMAEKHNLDDPRFPHKSFYYLGGLAEGTETIIIFALLCLFPNWFPVLALIFAVICLLTAALRVWGGYKTIASTERLKRQ